jgi:alanine racemase
VSNAAAQEVARRPLLVTKSTDIHGSVTTDTVVEKNCHLRIHGNLLGDLTIEPGAVVIVDGSVDGRITNRGGSLTVHNKGLAAYVDTEGPPEAEAGAILKVNLSAIASNWTALKKRADAECAAVIRGNAYGCGIEPVTGVLLKSGCKTFFVSSLSEAKIARKFAADATIYVLDGLFPGTEPEFAKINARPVINSSLELAQWDIFAKAAQWTGGCAVNVDTGSSKLGLSVEEANALAGRIQSPDHGINLVMSRLDKQDQPDQAAFERQVGRFREVRRMFNGVPASFADSAAIFMGPQASFDLVRAGSAMYGVNPMSGVDNPMQPVLELNARIARFVTVAPGESIADNAGWTAKRRTRIALACVGYADGYPRIVNATAQAFVGGYRCAVVGSPSMDLLSIDISDLPDPTVARCGDLATVIGFDFGIDQLAAAGRISGRELLTRLGQRFHRVYYTI